MAAQMQITFVMDDGAKHETLFAPGFVDSVAFERHFKTSSMVLDVAKAEVEKMQQAAQVRADGDAAAADALEDQLNFSKIMRMEWIAYFGWRSLRRRGPGPNVSSDFEVFLDHVEEMLLSAFSVEEDESADPDAAAALSGGIIENPDGSLGEAPDPTGPSGPPPSSP